MKRRNVRTEPSTKKTKVPTKVVVKPKSSPKDDFLEAFQEIPKIRGEIELRDVYDGLRALNENLREFATFSLSMPVSTGSSGGSSKVVRIHPDDLLPGQCKFPLSSGPNAGLCCGAKVKDASAPSTSIESIACNSCIKNEGRKEKLKQIMRGEVPTKKGKAVKVRNPGTSKETTRKETAANVKLTYTPAPHSDKILIIDGTDYIVYSTHDRLVVGALDKEGKIRNITKEEKEDLTENYGINRFAPVRASVVPKYMSDYNKAVDEAKAKEKANKSKKGKGKKKSKKVIEDSESESEEAPKEVSESESEEAPKEVSESESEEVSKSKKVIEDSDESESEEAPKSKKVIEDSDESESEEAPKEVSESESEKTPKSKKVIEDSDESESDDTKDIINNSSSSED